MKFTERQWIIIFGILLFIVIAVVALYLGGRPSASQGQKVTSHGMGYRLGECFSGSCGAYKNTAGVDLTINYTQIYPANYQSKLLSAFAAGTGPDIFEIGNRDLPQWLSVTTPIPAAFFSSFNITTLQNDFPTVITQDFVAGGVGNTGGSANSQIYALPA